MPNVLTSHPSPILNGQRSPRFASRPIAGYPGQNNHPASTFYSIPQGQRQTHPTVQRVLSPHRNPAHFSQPSPPRIPQQFQHSSPHRIPHQANHIPIQQAVPAYAKNSQSLKPQPDTSGFRPSYPGEPKNHQDSFNLQLVKQPQYSTGYPQN